MDQTSDRIFKEGNLSPVVYSFAQMKGVTSTTLVDFSCRFTWSVTDFKENDKNQNMSISSHPEPRCISSQRHIPSRDSFSHLHNQPLCHSSQAYPCPATPNQMSSPLSSTMSSPLSHPLSLPPPHMRIPNYNQQCAYPCGQVTPKTFSPVLIYQRPSVTVDERFKDAEITEIPNSDFEKDMCRFGLQGLAYKRGGCDYVKESECIRSGLGLTSDGYQNCLKPEFKRSGLVAPYQPKMQQHWLPGARGRAEKDVFKLPHSGHSTASAFQAWRPHELKRSSNFPYLPECKPSSQQAPNTDSAKLKFFLDTKYGLTDGSELPVAMDPEMGLKPEFTSGFPSEYQLETPFSDPFLEMLNDPLLTPSSEDGDDRRGRKYKCPYCSVSCANNGQLKGHLRVHTGEKPFRCDFVDCGRAFARNEELTRHRRIHSGLRPHTCNTCGKKFGRKDHLNKHQKTHLKTAEKKVHMCNVPGCEQRYTRSDALARHQWGAHGIKSKSPKWRTQVRDNKQTCV